MDMFVTVHSVHSNAGFLLFLCIMLSMHVQCDLKLKDNGNCCQYDTEDQQKTVSSDETQYFKKSFAAFAFSRIFYC